jgi:D-alanine--poly(phosphoribitol) ligase subunit 2
LRQDILNLVYAAIDEVNALTTEGIPVEKSPDTSLLGGEQGMDSLTFVNLIVALEEQIQLKTGQSIVLVDENSMSQQEQPFRSVGTLANYVETLLGPSAAQSID